MHSRAALSLTLVAAAVATPALAGFPGTDVFLPSVGRAQGVANWYTELLGATQTLPTATAEQRYNFGFVETSGSTCSVKVTPFDTTGAALASAKTYTVRALEQKQYQVRNEFRNQLTCIGRFAQAIVEEEITDNRFTIRTNPAQIKVSWQVMAERNDAWMRAHPYAAEQDKPEAERGLYVDPGAYGQPEEKGVVWVRRPDMVQRMKESRKAVEEAQEQQ